MQSILGRRRTVPDLELPVVEGNVTAMPIESAAIGGPRRTQARLAMSYPFVSGGGIVVAARSPFSFAFFCFTLNKKDFS